MQQLLDQLSEQTKTANLAIKGIHDTRKRIARAAKRQGMRRAAPRRPHPGLSKTTQLQPGLAALLGVSPADQLKRYEINMLLHRYADANNLKDPDNRQYIILDAALAAETRPDRRAGVGARIHMFSLYGFLNVAPAGASAGAGAPPAGEAPDEILEDFDE